MRGSLRRAIVPSAAVDQYTWLRSLPFVTYQSGRCRYHDVVRDSLLRLQRTHFDGDGDQARKSVEKAGKTVL